jgi:hypothetical protein
MVMVDLASGGSCVQPPENMVAWWPLDETVGDTSQDIVGNNTGTWMGSPTPVTGEVAGALDFNGVIDYVKVPDAPELNFGTGDFSIDAWIRTDSNGTYEVFVDKRDYNAIGYEFLLYNGRLALGLGDNTGWSSFYKITSPNLRNGAWHFVAVTVNRDDPNGGKLYCDGGLIYTFNPTIRAGNITNSADLWIGRHHPVAIYDVNMWFDGSIDEVELFNRALDANEILAIYQAGSAGKCKCEPAVTYRDDIKWSQPPDYRPLGCINGWDEVSNYYTQPIIADDWVCMDGRPIKGIHWWGSFQGWTEPNQALPYDMPSAFHIGIWTDVPKSSTNTFSHPGQLIWENISDCYVWSYAGCDVDPRKINGVDTCFEFEQLLSQDNWFYQYGNEPNGTVYWLSIAAIYGGETPVHPWGWKTRPHFYHDDAVRIFPPASICPNSCPEPNESVFWAGIADNFNLPAEPAFQSPQLKKSDSGYTGVWRNFDETVDNQRFGHTFTGLPECIVAATLEIRMKATGDIPSTDSLGLALHWGQLIKNLSSTGHWLSGETQTFLLNLDALPTSSTPFSVLPYMNKNQMLDVYIQDDTSVDYMILRVWSCPKVPGPWPPTVGSFYENGQAIEYPTGTSWDMAFVLTTNRMYTPRRGYYPTSISGATSIATPVSQVDFDGDLIVNFKDFAEFAGCWLTEGEVWPEFDLP